MAERAVHGADRVAHKAVNRVVQKMLIGLFNRC